jgi:hypothetical protein
LVVLFLCVFVSELHRLHFLPVFQIEPHGGRAHANPTEAGLAIDFLRRVDELVWRRSGHGSPPWGPLDPIFSRENVSSLMDRLTLWESIVRGPAIRP